MMADYFAEIRVKRVEIMPYHSIGESKYAMLGRGYLMEGRPGPGPNSINRFYGTSSLRALSFREAM